MMALSDALVVGLYGVSGVGKSRAMADMSKERIEWRCLEGSQKIRDVLSAQGLNMDDFQHNMTEDEKTAIRKKAAESIRKEPGVSIVAGHCSFPVEFKRGQNSSSVVFDDVFTQSDGHTYDAIFYLDKPAELIALQRQKDGARKRLDLSLIHI